VGGPSSNVPDFTATSIGKATGERIPELALDTPVGDTGADLNPATGIVKIRGGGGGVPSAAGTNADEMTFLHQSAAGNFQLTVNALRFPTFENGQHSTGGIMIREDMTPGARHAQLSLTCEEGIVFRSRPAKDADTNASDPDVTWQDARDGLNSGKPILFRLTRTGDVIKAEYSLDGTTFTEASGSPVTLSGLASKVEVGVAVSAATPENDTGDAVLRISEMMLRDLKITPQ